MKIVKVDLVLYYFPELNPTARTTAIESHRQVILSELKEKDFSCKGDYETFRKMHISSDVYVIDNIMANEYMYFEDGTMANVVTYTGKHLKTGTSELTYHGKVYVI